MATQCPGRGTILLVEDDPLVRMVIAEALEDAGFPVVTAETGDQALQRLSSGFVPLAIVTDIALPGSTDGIRLACWVSQHRADVGIIVMSGRQAADIEDLPHGVPFLAKPFSLAKLIGSLNEVIPAKHMQQA